MNRTDIETRIYVAVAGVATTLVAVYALADTFASGH